MKRCPPQATTDVDLQMQLRLLRDPVRECVVTIEYVDAYIHIAEAREETGGRVSITSNTTGIDWETLAVGVRLHVAITRFNHAATAEHLSHE